VSRSSHPRGPRRGVPWWTPLLCLALLALAVAGGILATRSHGREAAAPATTAGVLGTQATKTTADPAPTTAAAPPAAKPSALMAGTTSLLPVPDGGLDGYVGHRVNARSVRVLDVVGRRIFWVGTDGRERLLVHLQGYGTRWQIHPPQHLTFTGIVTENRPGSAAGWGLTLREGAGLFRSQGYHLEVYGPRIRFR
jgi:hypothetical protein